MANSTIILCVALPAIFVMVLVIVALSCQLVECNRAFNRSEQMSEQRRQRIVQLSQEKMKPQTPLTPPCDVSQVMAEVSKPGFTLPVGRYRPHVWKAAMDASYALEGVKDQSVINVMVADSILTKPAVYREYRDRLASRITPESLAILDAWAAGEIGPIV